jgi:hypothetical protein
MRARVTTRGPGITRGPSSSYKIQPYDIQPYRIQLYQIQLFQIQPHWHGLPDWHPHPQPEPQPHAPITVRVLIAAGCSVGRSCVGSGWGVLGDSAMGPSSMRGPERPDGRTGPCTHCMPAPLGASTAHRGSPTPRTSPGRRVQAPSTPVTGWMSCWISSACSPVTRYTTRLATDTAWSANRS